MISGVSIEKIQPNNPGVVRKESLVGYILSRLVLAVKLNTCV